MSVPSPNQELMYRNSAIFDLQRFSSFSQFFLVCLAFTRHGACSASFYFFGVGRFRDYSARTTRRTKAQDSSLEASAQRSQISKGSAPCYWIETEYGSDCDWTVPTDDPLAYDPGCCMMANTADPTTLWMEKCTLFGTLYDCLLPTTEYGDSRCAWQPAPTDFDCSQLWPTMPPPAGCCAGTSGVATTQCLAEEDSSRCDRLSGCHWISGEGADCEWKTTAKPWEAGCCQIVFDTPSNADSGWTDLCRSFWNEEECNAPRSTDEYARCFWTPTDEGTDCGDVWPSTTDDVVDGGCCTLYI